MKEEQKIIRKAMLESLANDAGLKCIHWGVEKKILPTVGSSNHWIGLKAVMNSWHTDNPVKPILRRLSQLTEPITVEGYNDGKEFVPMEMIQDDLIAGWCIAYDDWVESFKNNPCLSRILQAPYQIVRLFIHWGFFLGPQDYFDKGLIIEKTNQN